MKAINLITSIFVLFVIAPNFKAQEFEVRKIFYDDQNLSVTKTPFLSIFNGPTQLVQMQLTGRSLKNSQQIERLEKITISLNSHSGSPRYQKDPDHRLIFEVDGKVLDLGLLNYRVLKATSGQRGDYVANPSSGWVMRLPVTSEWAAAEKNLASDVVEMMYLDLELEQLEKLVNAKRVLLRLGLSTFDFTANNIGFLNQFFRRLITPGEALKDLREQSEPEPEMGELESSAPSASNATPLPITIQWIRNEIRSRARTRDSSGTRIKTEVSGSSDCEIRYRESQSEEPPSIYDLQIYIPSPEYIIDLTQLNPEATKVGNPVDGRTWINLATHDNIPKIERRTLEFGSSKILAKKYEASASISLRSTRPAYRLEDALVHAIRLCKASR